MKKLRRTIIAALAGSAWLTTVLLARPGVVVTQSGARYEGDVVERGDDVIVVIRGVQTTIPRGEVASLDYSLSFERELADRLARLDAQDIDSRLELARWAMKQEQYTAARDVVESALVIDPNNAAAVELQNLIRSQMRLAATARIRGVKPVESPERSAEAGSAEESEPAVKPGLRQEDIQAIRRIEWRSDDQPVRVRVDADAGRSYASMKQMRYEDFARLKPVDQARMVLNDPNSTAEQRQGVQILSDPPSMAEFRRVVQPILLTGCASSGCHGSATADFRLTSPATTDEAAYSNFLKLNTYTKRLDRQVPDGGIFGGATEVRMIDRGNASKSLLVQYSLPPELAEFDHPKVPNYQPLFQSLNDPRGRNIVNWIDRSLRLYPGEYGFEPPRRAQPTTESSR